MIRRFRFSCLSTVTPAVCVVFPDEFEITFRLPVLGDGTEKILPTPVVSPNNALLLRFTPCALNVRHCFFWQVVNRFLSVSSLTSAELASWACPCSNHMQPLSTWK
jgi:hypothetical protein